MKAIKKQISQRYITTDCNENVVHSGEGFTITANPRSSYGYLYIVAYRL